MVTDRGEHLDLLRDSPAFVKTKVAEGVIRWRNRAIEAKHPTLVRGDGAEGPHLMPIIRLLESKKAGDEWNAELRGSLRSAVVDRQWTQTRLKSAKLVDSVACQLCVAMGICAPHSEEPEHRGTLVHRTCTCPVLEPYRKQHMPHRLYVRMRRALKPDGTMDAADLLWYTRTLRPSPLCEVPIRVFDETFQWTTCPAGGMFEGKIYTDGSLMDGDWQFEKRCLSLGWSFSAVDINDVVVAAARGRPPSWITDIYGTELWATQQVTSHVLPSTSRLITDCDSVRDGYNRGRKWATAPGRRYARVWNVIYSASDTEEAMMPVIWMPAHTAEREIGVVTKSNGAVMTKQDRDNNALVDTSAKIAAGAGRVRQAVRATILEAVADTTDMAIWIAKVTTLANHFRCLDGTILRDSQASSAVQRRRNGMKRKDCDTEMPEMPCIQQRLAKCPRYAAIIERIRCRGAGPEAARALSFCQPAKSTGTLL